MKKFLSITISLLLLVVCAFTSACVGSNGDGSAADDSDITGNSTASPVGCKWFIYEYDENVPFNEWGHQCELVYNKRTVGKAVVINESCQLVANKRYVIYANFNCSGGSSPAVILSQGVSWEYDSQQASIWLAEEDSSSTWYFIEGYNSNTTTTVTLRTGEFAATFDIKFVDPLQTS